MKEQHVFKRFEIKYLITKTQQRDILQNMAERMDQDAYGRSTICNIYLDTPDYLLIRRSIDGPVYKEKLRLRSYGTATPDSKIFLELKKKYQSVVYKRRISLPEKEAMAYLQGNGEMPDTQISREIAYTLQHYTNLQPAVFLSYEREAFFAKDDPLFRITFDENILWRDYDVSLCDGVYGMPILDGKQVLMEMKTVTAIPLWLTALLSEKQIKKCSFSKYGNAYRSIFYGSMHQNAGNAGGVLYA